jgi:hypothetical protein
MVSITTEKRGFYHEHSSQRGWMLKPVGNLSVFLIVREKGAEALTRAKQVKKRELPKCVALREFTSIATVG